MARKGSPTISQEELYPQEEQEYGSVPEQDARLLDLDVEQESPFLRGQKRVSVRRSSLPKKTANRLKWAALVSTVVVCLGFFGYALYSYGEHSWRFRIESSDQIEIAGSQNVTHSQVMEVLGGDIGRNIFFIPLSQRKAQLEQIPWVESASIMRFVPNRLKVEIHERTPVAFARIGPRIVLMDSGGSVMDLPPAGQKKYSFPVIAGMNPGEPLSTRAARMKIYNELIAQLDSGGGHYSQDLSEVDLSDPDDVKVSAVDPSGEVLVHLGASDFLDRYKIYVSHIREWRQQFEKLDSVDLRYRRQVIVNPDLNGMVASAPMSQNAARAAMAAGVKPAALITREIEMQKAAPAVTQPQPLAKPVAQPAEKKNRAKKWHSRRPAAKILAKSQHLPKTAVAKPSAASANTAIAKTNTAPAVTSKKPSPAVAKQQDHP